MNTYCDDCKRCTGGCMVESEVPGDGDDHNRCHECEAALQGKIADLEAQLSAAKNAIVGYVKCFKERDALREWCDGLESDANCELIKRKCAEGRTKEIKKAIARYLAEKKQPGSDRRAEYAALASLQALAATEVKP